MSVPPYVRPKQLTHCLQSLAQLDYPHECFEVIVVDDGSEKLPEAIIASFRDKLNQTHARRGSGRFWHELGF